MISKTLNKESDELLKAQAMDEQANKMKAEAKDLIIRAKNTKREKLLGFVRAAGYETAEEMANDLRRCTNPAVGIKRTRVTEAQKSQAKELFASEKKPSEVASIVHISLPTTYKLKREFELAAA